MNTLISLRILQVLHEMRLHPIASAFRVLKYMFYTLSIYQLMLVKAFILDRPSIMTMPQLLLFTSIDPLFLTLAVAVLCAHLSIKITDPLPVKPFWRFYPIRIWYVKNLIYSLLSANVLFIFCILLISFSFKGVAYFVFFIVVFTHSFKSVSYRLIYMSLISILYLSKYPEYVNISAVFVCSSIVYWHDITKIHSIKLCNRTQGLNFHLSSIVLTKELEFIKYYSSERFYMSLGTIFAGLLISLIFQFDGTENFPILKWLYMVIPFIPISLIIFNSFGMDYSVIRKLFYYSEQTFFYIGKKNHVYKIITHSLNLAITLSFLFSLSDKILALQYFVGSTIFIDVIFTAGIFHSILFCERKEIKYRYGQYLRSQNLNYQQLLMLIIVILFIPIDHLAGIQGLIIVYVIFQYLKKTMFEKSLLWCMNHQRGERTDYGK